MSALHLLGQFSDPHAGADIKLIEIARNVAPHRTVHLWSDGEPHESYARSGVRSILGDFGQHPLRGSLLVGGVHVALGNWLQFAILDRLALNYNLPNHGALFTMLDHLQDVVAVEPEIIYVSPGLRESVGLPGSIEPSLVDIEALVSLPPRGVRNPVTVGRLSRDVPEKHHPADLSIYRMLAERGVRVRVMGGTCLAKKLGPVAGVELLPAGAEPLSHFLASLDVFFYRTGSFFESYGRVIFEAMASCLPLVASAHGGYIEWVQGHSGVRLVHDQEAAWHELMVLCSDADIRSAEAAKARARAVELHGPEARKALIEKYLR